MVINYSNLATGRFEGRTSDQYIGTSFTFRTDSSNGLWDLSIFTNTAVGPQRWGGYEDAWDDNLPRVPGIPDSLRRRSWNRQPWSWVRRPTVPSNPPHDRSPGVFIPTTDFPGNNFGTDNPSTPIIVVNYSMPATSDLVTIGTH